MRQEMLRESRLGRYTAVQVIARTGGLCHLCTAPVGEEWQVTHIIAVTIGGPDCLENVAAAHPACNLRKPRTAAGTAISELRALAEAAYYVLHEVEFAGEWLGRDRLAT